MAPVARYDAHVEWYEAFRPSLSGYETDVLRRFLGHGSGHCLDLGCGSGVAIPILEHLGWTGTGVDVSEPMLERARSRAPDAELIHAHANALPFADESFDAVVSIWTHTDVDDFPALVREVARVLRAGSAVRVHRRTPVLRRPALALHLGRGGACAASGVSAHGAVRRRAGTRPGWTQGAGRGDASPAWPLPPVVPGRGLRNPLFRRARRSRVPLRRGFGLSARSFRVTG